MIDMIYANRKTLESQLEDATLLHIIYWMH